MYDVNVGGGIAEIKSDDPGISLEDVAGIPDYSTGAKNRIRERRLDLCRNHEQYMGSWKARMSCGEALRTLRRWDSGV